MTVLADVGLHNPNDIGKKNLGRKSMAVKDNRITATFHCFTVPTIKFKAFAPMVEVNGETVFAIVDGMGSFRQSALHILAENNIPDPKAGFWYSQQNWLNAFNGISERIGPKTLHAIGQKIPENAQFPPEIDSIEKALGAIDVAYHMNHRGGDIGSYHFASTGPRSAKLVCTNPYPCDFDNGIITAMEKRFAPGGSVPKVRHDDSCPCRKMGAESCTYTVSW